MPSSCCIKGCSNKQTFYGYSMFGFPNDPDIKTLWVKAVGPDYWEPKSHHRVCEVHFEPDLIHFVGSRKELKKSAIPTLFCNCSYISSLQKTQTAKSETTNNKFNLEATTLDHSYSQNLLVFTEHNNKEKDCINKQDSEACSVKRKSLKHTADCNIMREPLRNTLKLKDPAVNRSGILNKMSLPSKPALIGPMNHLIKKTTTHDSQLRSQLKNALDENAKLKQELSMMKGRLLPVTLLPSNNVKFIQLKKVT